MLLLACAPAPEGDDTAPPEGPQDIREVHLALDVSTLSAEASLLVRPASGTDTVELDTHGLGLVSAAVDGAPVEPAVEGGLARFPVRPGGDTVRIDVAYTFPARTMKQFDGWMPDLGVSFVWPEGCGNLYPCHPGLDDGVRFGLEVTGYDAGLTAVYAEDSVGDAPAYMPALAVGDFATLDLGTTPGGTELTVWYLAGGKGEEHARQGTEHLAASWDWLERTIGPYAFGPKAGSVEVDWGFDSYGGMEHHPYFHVGKLDFWNGEAQVHEAVHGWYGDGVRFGCWEDFVLSEGTTTYLTARAVEEVGGPNYWETYVNLFLGPICEGEQPNTIAWPDTCGEIVFETSELWSLVPYMKGACFYEDVGEVIGLDAVDAAISELYQDRVGKTATMDEMITRLKERGTSDQADQIDALVRAWLKTEACPADYASRCKRHGG